MIIIMGWRRIGRGKSSPTTTNVNNTIVTNLTQIGCGQLSAANRGKSIFFAKYSLKRSEQFNNVKKHNNLFYTMESSGGY